MYTLDFVALTKRYGSVTAVDSLTARVEPGRITAFLGANGSGKTTSMRVLLGLTDPTSGTATINGRSFRDLERPLNTVGAVLGQQFHPGRTARNHMRIVAAQAGAPSGRIDQLLDEVGLSGAARRRAGAFSLGMRQRLALASALVGEPSVLVLDEPFNGLDPNGIQAMRALLRRFADDGGTVLLSSHLLGEIAQCADDAIIIDRGRLVAAGPVVSLLPGRSAVLVTAADADLLALALTECGAAVERTAPDRISVSNVSRELIGATAAELRVAIFDMRSADSDLESAFQSLVHATGSLR
jgi:ABC-2 type transport system ATP-binding protein